MLMEYFESVRKMKGRKTVKQILPSSPETFSLLLINTLLHDTYSQP